MVAADSRKDYGGDPAIKTSCAMESDVSAPLSDFSRPVVTRIPFASIRKEQSKKGGDEEEEVPLMKARVRFPTKEQMAAVANAKVPEDEMKKVQ